MKEDFLHYIWQYRLFGFENLVTTDGTPVSILHPGSRNPNAGPDFFNAKTVINHQPWAGNVEIHINGNDWNTHGHQHDPAYNNVILHVVFTNPITVYNERGRKIPTLVLEKRIPAAVIDRYAHLEVNKNPVACHQMAHEVPPVILTSMLSKALIHRLERKSAEVLQVFESSGKSWEQTCYEIIAQNFGFQVNAQPFRQLARSLPVNILARYKQDVFFLEALLLGQAGFLDDTMPRDGYTTQLQKEYRYLQHKHRLTPLSATIWKFSRMRPANFPTIRIAQFAALIHHSRAMFSSIIENETLAELSVLFGHSPSPYWLEHYKPGVPSHYRNKTPGAGSNHSLIINTVVPLLFAYSIAREEPVFRDRALSFLENLPPETNAVTNRYREARFPLYHAFDSQAVLELHKTWCSAKKCLHCSIGVHVLKQA